MTHARVWRERTAGGGADGAGDASGGGEEAAVACCATSSLGASRFVAGVRSLFFAAWTVSVLLAAARGADVICTLVLPPDDRAAKGTETIDDMTLTVFVLAMRRAGAPARQLYQRTAADGKNWQEPRRAAVLASDSRLQCPWRSPDQSAVDERSVKSRDGEWRQGELHRLRVVLAPAQSLTSTWPLFRLADRAGAHRRPCLRRAP